MKDSSNIKRAPHDSEQTLLQKDHLSDAENCLNTMKKIASLIEAVSILYHPSLLIYYFKSGGALAASVLRLSLIN
jgi:hypothetical protein